MTDTSSTAAILAHLPAPLPPPQIDPASLETHSLKVIARLRRHGHAAYLVGGCVRDLLVGAHPKDFDVATSAHPDDIRGIFRNSRLIGRRFRLAHVFFPGGQFVEVATFRSNPLPEPDTGVEGEATDLLVTDDNQFGTAQEDALRRDFTVNGLFYDVIDGRVIDYVGGREDLDRKSIRTIGDPEIRLREDPVRGLRAARIAAKLQFDIEPETFAAMVRHAGELPRCAAARVLDETLKLLRSGTSSRAFLLLRRANVLRYLLPPIEDVLALGGPATEARFLQRLAALDGMVHDGEPVTDAVMLATLLSFLPMTPGAPASTDEEEEEPDDLAQSLPSADRVLAQMSSQARLPRKVADRVRAIIGSQRLFYASPRKKRRRGSGGFARTPHFPEALQLLEIVVRATGEDAEIVTRWKTKASQAAAVHATRLAAMAAAPPTPPEPTPPGEDEVTVSAAELPPAAPESSAAGAVAAPSPAKKRRRRGGRHKKKTPVSEPGSTPPVETSGEPVA